MSVMYLGFWNADIKEGNGDNLLWLGMARTA